MKGGGQAVTGVNTLTRSRNSLIYLTDKSTYCTTLKSMKINNTDKDPCPSETYNGSASAPPSP